MYMAPVEPNWTFLNHPDLGYIFYRVLGKKIKCIRRPAPSIFLLSPKPRFLSRPGHSIFTECSVKKCIPVKPYNWRIRRRRSIPGTSIFAINKYFCRVFGKIFKNSNNSIRIRRSTCTRRVHVPVFLPSAR